MDGRWPVEEWRKYLAERGAVDAGEDNSPMALAELEADRLQIAKLEAQIAGFKQQYILRADVEAFAEAMRVQAARVFGRLPKAAAKRLAKCTDPRQAEEVLHHELAKALATLSKAPAGNRRAAA